MLKHNTDLIPISKFAQLVGTTRRTLIFYDQKDIFKPKQIGENNYRYYGYDQIYKIELILGMRDLGLSISEIKDYLDDESNLVLNEKLLSLKEKVEQKIANLQQVLAVLNQKETDNLQLLNNEFYVPQVAYLSEKQFWCSDLKVDCSEAEISQAYSDFYHRLDPGIIVNRKASGFLVDLPGARADSYADAAFRIIKEKSSSKTITNVIPIISQNAGKYLLVKVKSNNDGIEKGLAKIRSYAAQKHLQISKQLWQFNIGVDVKQLGLTENSILLYQII